MSESDNEYNHPLRGVYNGQHNKYNEYDNYNEYRYKSKDNNNNPTTHKSKVYAPRQSYITKINYDEE